MPTIRISKLYFVSFKKSSVIGYHNDKMFAVSPVRPEKLLVLVSGRWLVYSSTRILYVQTPPVFYYCTRMYSNCRDDKGCVEIIVWNESELMSIAGFSAS